MKILIAEDDRISRQLLKATLERWQYDTQVCVDGLEALAALEAPGAPSLAILDWMMPGLDGVDVCRRIKAQPRRLTPYLMLLTTRTSTEDIVTGLQAGADDYLPKPFQWEELQARVHVGIRYLELQARLAERVEELEQALARVKQLQGLLPICAYCRKVRDDRDYWQQVDTYVAQHFEVRFSHGICPDCYSTHVQRELEAFERNQ